MLYRIAGLFAFCVCAPLALADINATTVDGRKVLLRDNGTWSYIEKGDDQGKEPRAVLALENKIDLARGCRLGLRLNNELPARIRTLVLRFTAYKGDQIAFETVSRGYSFVKPTTSQYQEISFRGISCDEIRSIAVSAARNCHVGDLTKYSASAKRCLELVDVRPSELMAIAKQLSK